MKTKSALELVLILVLLVGSPSVFLAHAQIPIASIDLTKVASETYVLSGTSVSYLYNATNTGTTLLNGNITDNVYGTVGAFINLQPGGWVGFNVTQVINATTSNIATVTAEDQFGTLVSDSATATVRVLLEGPHIEVTKTCEPCAQSAPGTVTWNVTVTNIGTVPLNGVNATDSRHGYLGSVGTLNPGQSIFFIIVDTDLQPGVFTDTANAYGWYVETDTIVTDSGTAECVVTPKFVIPEVPFGTITALSSIILAVALALGITKLKRKGDPIQP